MNVFAEVEIRSSRGTQYLFDTMRRFCIDSTEWMYDEDRSATYSDNLLESVGCLIVVDDSVTTKLAIALCEEKAGFIKIVNIVPKETGSISVNKYNSIAAKLHQDVKKWSRANSAGLRLRISNTDPSLDEIISAKIPLRSFRLFLGNHPLSYHPLDIERLDRFICAVSRYSRKRIDWGHLGQYLLEKESWPQKDVEWCLERIRTGLDVITVYKSFH